MQKQEILETEKTSRCFSFVYQQHFGVLLVDWLFSLRSLLIKLYDEQSHKVCPIQNDKKKDLFNTAITVNELNLTIMTL